MYTLAQADPTEQTNKKNQKSADTTNPENTNADTDSTVSSSTTATGTVTEDTSTTTTATEETAEVTNNAEDATTNTTTNNANEAITTVSLDNVTKQVNIGNPSWDVMLGAFFLVTALLYGLTLGRDRIVAIIVSIYMALAIVTALPDFVFNLVINDNYTVQITAFLGLFVVLFFMLSRRAVLNAIGTTNDGKLWQTLLFSILHVGLLVSVTLSFLPPQVLGKFSSFTLWLFTDEWTKFGWIVAPVLAMIVAGKRE